MNDTAAYDEGVNCAKKDLPITANHYENGSFNYLEWERGYKEYQDDCKSYHDKYDLEIKGLKEFKVTVPDYLKKNALNNQVGGTHYQECKIQPIEFIEANGLSFLEGSIVKRIARHGKPTGKGKEDIKKVIHEAQLLLQLRYGENV